MPLKQLLATPIRIPPRWVATVVLIVALAIVAVVFASTRVPPPRFTLARGEGRVAAVHYPWWQQAGDWIRGRKYAVLTFDDGPYGHGVDEQILHILDKHHAHAIFFLVCAHITEATQPVPAEIRQAGHVIGNHSYDHPHLLTLSAEQLHHQIQGCSTRISAVAGSRPAWFRPPFGETSARVVHAVRLAGMQQMLWDANSEDSWLLHAEQIRYWSLKQTDNGSILLMHDKPTTAVALDDVLTRLEQRGFRFVLPDSPT